MINKKTRSIKFKLENYIEILLTSGYIFGVLIGCFYTLSNNCSYDSLIVSNKYFYTIIYFIITIILKYSGILSGAVCTLPIVLGIQNSAYYCSLILSYKYKFIYNALLMIIRDTAIIILLILYITIIMYQIINKKYNIKKDIRLFFMYFSGSVIINLLHYMIYKFIY